MRCWDCGDGLLFGVWQRFVPYNWWPVFVSRRVYFIHVRTQMTIKRLKKLNMNRQVPFDGALRMCFLRCDWTWEQGTSQQCLLNTNPFLPFGILSLFNSDRSMSSGIDPNIRCESGEQIKRVDVDAKHNRPDMNFIQSHYKRLAERNNVEANVCGFSGEIVYFVYCQVLFLPHLPHVSQSHQTSIDNAITSSSVYQDHSVGWWCLHKLISKILGNGKTLRPQNCVEIIAEVGKLNKLSI